MCHAAHRRPRSFIGTAGREMDAKWDDNGAGAVFFLEQEMSDAVSGAPRWIELALFVVCSTSPTAATGPPWAPPP